ncbi:hypothetical protein SPBR_03808 [Sporothrix brasiliensis 5110]|uniref:Uncharacterized protein n=1 Tax=Sporothrix brasiliensis 5110 TaxID=1398154 RepID=A0A0C2JD28_9PEZI|nr:uncharacterized protein SPBR_03808 [Sporothrix brasiliensis 5110]KIH94842.1 hypothetical protein SPBR_03808 [Sporothrix brasiliensis 5110]
MSARLEEHMRIRRQFQACGAKRLGPILPDEILDQFTAAVTADDRDAVRALLDTYFPDRTQLIPGQYNIHELFPVISQAARNDQADVLKELFVPYPFPYQSTDFVAREAIDAGSKHTLLLLLEHGWDINQRIHPGPNVLESLLHLGAQDRDMVIWLVAHGASLNVRPEHKDMTGMSQAVEHTSLELVRELVDEWGGDVHRGQLLHHALKRQSRTQSGTPVSKPAAASDIVEMLGLLLERGAPLNLTFYADDEASSQKYRNSDHGTPLHEAAYMGHVEAVQYLLAQGADTSIVSTRSKTTALAWAEKAGHEDVVAMLREPDQYKL